MNLEEIKEIAKKHLEKNDPIHGWHHTRRVYNLSLKLGEKEGADLEVLKLAALLHDLRIHEDRENHEVVSAELAAKILEDWKKKDEVIHCIKAHRFSKNVRPKTIEAKILQDADRLDATGAIGIMRTTLLSGHLDRPIHIPEREISRDYNGTSRTTIDHFYEKLLKIKDELNTGSAKQIAERRHEFMEDFLDEFFKEWEGDR